MYVRCFGRKNDGRPAYRDPVTLEGEAELGAAVGGDRLVPSRRRLRLGGLLAEVLDDDAALDRPNREPLLVGEDGNASGLTTRAGKARQRRAKARRAARERDKESRQRKIDQSSSGRDLYRRFDGFTSDPTATAIFIISFEERRSR